MENLIDFKSIWKSAATDSLPGSTEMIAAIKKYRNKQVRKFIWLVVFAFMMCAMMTFILITFKNIQPITIVGGLLIIFAGLLMLLTNLNSLQRFFKLNACSNREYLAFLQKTHLRQRFYYKYTQPAVFFLTVTGIFLYSFPALKSNFYFTALTLTFLSIYFIIMWLYVRPRMYKKGTKHLDKKVADAKRIAQQF
jgi:hypothetical protein